MLRSRDDALRGEIETLRYETENSDERQRELYVDVDRRLAGDRNAPRGVGAGVAAPPSRRARAPARRCRRAAPACAARPAGSDQQNYQAAFDSDAGAQVRGGRQRRSRQFLAHSRRARSRTTRSTGSPRRTTCAGNTRTRSPEFRKVLERVSAVARSCPMRC